jgi:protein-S-isoprenylcysteine O-methyltransferase Ste14
MSSYRWIYHPRNFWTALPLLFALISSYKEIQLYDATWVSGGLIFLTGVGIRIWSQQHLRYRMRIHKVLTTTGPYRVIRNPLYFGNTLTYVGATICSGLIWFAPITFIWAIAVYGFVVRHEEKQLVMKFGGAYRMFLREVPR